MARVYWRDNDSIPKEQKVSEGQDEYQIPVLVKGDAKRSGTNRCRLYRGKVIMCQKIGGLHYGPLRGDNDVTPNWFDEEIIPYPTQAQVEEEQAKLKPKPDTLPAPVREALQAADLGCRREGVEKLIEAIYSNPPKVSP